MASMLLKPPQPDDDLDKKYAVSWTKTKDLSISSKKSFKAMFYSGGKLVFQSENASSQVVSPAASLESSMHESKQPATTVAESPNDPICFNIEQLEGESLQDLKTPRVPSYLPSPRGN